MDSRQDTLSSPFSPSSGFLARLTAFSQDCPAVKAAVLIGSQARESPPADEYSDTDLLILTDDPSFFLHSDQWLEPLGRPALFFTENTLAGGRERRVLFEDGRDADFIILPAESLPRLAENADFRAVISRAYRVLADRAGMGEVLRQAAARPPEIPLLSEEGFTNTVEDFWFHTVWAAKKILRGELWTAERCVGGYMRRLLLTMIEIHARALRGRDTDTWHEGRFLEQWAAPWIPEGLEKLGGGYSRRDILDSLEQTMSLYRRIAKEAAGALGFAYPEKADAFASGMIERLF